MSVTVEQVEPGDRSAIEAVQGLWKEYWTSFGLQADFQGFCEELETLPGKYAPPHGRLLLMRVDGQPAATIAFRALNETACEAKRLYVRPSFRGRGAARLLLEKLFEQARACGYVTLYGDTLPSMGAALDMYRRIGFVEVGPYSADPTPNGVYLRLDL